MRLLGTMCAVTGLLMSGVALGQASAPAATSGGLFAGEIQGNYARLKANVIKAAEKMPPENYSYKPMADIRTFARVVNHVTEAQMHICGAANGSSSDAKVPPETADKAVILDALKASYADCDKAYAGLTDANMADLLTLGPNKRSRLSLLWGNVAHDNEQYATLSLYLRLKGILPPSSEK